MTIPWLDALADPDSNNALYRHPWVLEDGSLIATSGKVLLRVWMTTACYPLIPSAEMKKVAPLLAWPLSRLGAIGMQQLRVWCDPSQPDPDCKRCDGTGRMRCVVCMGKGSHPCELCEQDAPCLDCTGKGDYVCSLCQKDLQDIRAGRIAGHLLDKNLLALLPRELTGEVEVLHAPAVKSVYHAEALVFRGNSPCQWQFLVALLRNSPLDLADELLLVDAVSLEVTPHA